jgi:tryptophan halogenase
MTTAAQALEQVVILGGGSAGLLAALNMKQRRPTLAVTVVRSTQLGVIGVGESTTAIVPRMLHVRFGIDPARFHRAVQPSFKVGIRFLWGTSPRFHFTFTPQFDRSAAELPRHKGFYCREGCDYADLTAALIAQDLAFEREPSGLPRLGGHLAYHLENHRFVAFLEETAVERGVRLLDRTVQDVVMAGGAAPRVVALILDGGELLPGDLFVDCSGFRSQLLGKALGEKFISFDSSLFNDRAVVGEWTRAAGETIKPYTVAETMSAGWAWQIDHPDLISRGYVYSSAFLSRDDAAAELKAANPRLGELREVRFRSGRYESAWVGNVVGLGNAVGFVEPLESSALAVICDTCVRMTDTLEAADWRLPDGALLQTYNRHHAFMWDSIRRFIAIHFKFNRRYQTRYWQACRDEVDLAGAEEIVGYYQEAGPSFPWPQLRHACEPFGVEGYLALLIGQGVPHRHERPLSAEEARVWADYRVRLRGLASTGLTIEDGLTAIASDGFVWEQRMFRNDMVL